MARQSKKHFIQLPTGPHRLTREQFYRLVAAGLVIVVADHLAQLRRSVEWKLQGGELWFLNPAWIKTSWIAIDRIAPVRGEHYEQDLKDQYEDPRGARRWQGYTEVKTQMEGWDWSFDGLKKHVSRMGRKLQPKESTVS